MKLQIILYYFITNKNLYLESLILRLLQKIIYSF